MNELALFAGAGGGIMGGLILGWSPVCAVEIDSYCRQVLLARQRDRVLPVFPIWDDVKTFDGRPWRGSIDIITAGFPCQPFSCAGRRKGCKDDRNLWPETFRIIQEVSPVFCLLENVPGIRRWLPPILADLRRIGYIVAPPAIVSAATVGAGHIRRRVWVLAYSNSDQLRLEQGRLKRARGKGPAFTSTYRPIPSNANFKRLQKRESITENTASKQQAAIRCHWWDTEPRLGRVAHGVAHRMDRLKAIGNGQVPAVVYLAWRYLVNNATEGEDYDGKGPSEAEKEHSEAGHTVQT